MDTHNPFIDINHDFQMFSFEHFAVLSFFALLGVSLIRIARRQSPEFQDQLGRGIAYVITGSIIIWTLIRLWIKEFEIIDDLPLQLCNFIALIIPIFAIKKSYWMYEILLFWIIAGTAQALITPDLFTAFPHYHFFKFWIVHAGLVLFMLYATFVYGMRPTLHSVFKSYLALQVYVVFTYLINLVLGSNYFYLNQKPPSASLLDLFGDWPMYIIVVEILLIPLFLLIYLPFYLANTFRKREKRHI